MGSRSIEPTEALERIARLRVLGVTWLTVGFAADTRQEYVAAMHGFGHHVIAHTT